MEKHEAALRRTPVTWMVTWLTLALVALALATIPGSVSLRLAPVDWIDPPLVTRPHGDAAIAVFVETNDPDRAATSIAHARVQAFALIEGRAYLVGVAETDRAGRARIAGLLSGEYWITADANARARSSTNVVLANGERAIEMTLAREHVLEVEIRDELGAKIRDAEIEVHGRDRLPLGARTRDDGSAHVTRLSEGAWTVVARAAGYEEVTERGVREGATLQVVLRKLGALVARVVDAKDAPVAGARVEIASATLWPARVAETGTDGTVRIAGLAAGSYATRAVRGGDVSTMELGIALARGEEKKITLRLGPGVFVALRVTDGDADDARGVRDARVTLAEAGLSPFPIEAVTDRDGRARLGPVAEGPSTLSARAEGFVARGAIAVPEPLPAEVRVALVRAGTIVGRIVDSRGFSVDGATIEIIGTDFQGAPIDDDPRRSLFREAHFEAVLGGPRPLIAVGDLGVMPGPVPPIPHGVSSFATSMNAPTFASSSRDEAWVSREDGTFRASPVSPGRVRALVRHPQYTDAWSDVVTLAASREVHVDVVMRAGGVLEGRVVDSHGQPIAGARVTIAATRGSMERTTRAASDGSFAFAAIPDEVTVMVARSDDLTDIATRLDVAIPEGGHRAVTIEVPDARPSLDARVTDDRGYPLDAVQLSASSLDPSAPLRATAFTDPRGEASIPGAKGLLVRIEARAPAHAPKVITVDPSASSVTIELARAESAIGEVRGAHHGEAIEDAEIVLYTELGARRTRSMKDGTFALADLAPGDARILVRAKGYAGVTRDLHLEGSGGARAFVIPRFELENEGSVVGVVTDEHGDPVPGARVARDRAPVYLALGAAPPDVAVTDPRGAFRLGGLAEGTITLDVFAPDVGRAHIEGIPIVAGRTTEEQRVVLRPDAHDKDAPVSESSASGGVAITLGETAEPRDIVVVDVAASSEAERAGLAPGDTIVEIDGAKVDSIEAARAKLSGPLAADVLVKVRRGEATFALRVSREPVRR